MFSSDTLEKSQIKQVNNKLGMKSSPAWLIKDPQFRLTRGVYKLPVNGLVNPSKNAKQISIPEVKQKISKQIQTTESTSENLIPNKEETFVPFGNYKDLKNYSKINKLFTKDIGFTNENNEIYIAGRLNRTVKVYGHRVNLDFLEKKIEDVFECNSAAIYKDKKIIIFSEKKIELNGLTNLQSNMFRNIILSKIPLNKNMKKNYLILQSSKF